MRKEKKGCAAIVPLSSSSTSSMIEKDKTGNALTLEVEGRTRRHFHVQITLFDKCVKLHKKLEDDKLGEWTDKQN